MDMSSFAVSSADLAVLSMMKTGQPQIMPYTDATASCKN
jgi:hypothetical protein